MGDDNYKIEIEFKNLTSPPVDFKPERPVPEKLMLKQMERMFGNGCPPGIKRLVIEQVKDDVRD